MSLSLSPTPFSPMTTTRSLTTPATSPPPSSEYDLDQIKEEDEDGDTVSREPKAKEEEVEEVETRMQMLDELLKKSAAYVSILKDQMDRVHAKYGNAQTVETQPEPPASAAGKKRKAADADDQAAKRKKTDEGTVEAPQPESPPNDDSTFVQPTLITGATLKGYQLEGVAWMVGLYQSGISGILADEMGLGKTLQTISFNAFLRERSVAPFMVVCPLSVLQNWVDEFNRFAPDIPVCMYHGTPEERAQLRRTKLVFSEPDMEWQSKQLGHGVPPPPPAKGKQRRSAKKAPAKTKAKQQREDTRKSSRTTKGKTLQKSTATPAPKKSGAAGRRSTRGRKTVESEHEDSEHEDEEDSDDAGPSTSKQEAQALPPHQATNFPVVITTYEMIIKDRAHLEQFAWGFIVVDEGHRLKNMDCRLIREIKKLNCSARMVLTGTPLHNNLAELWALLNFVLPDIFNDLDAFQEWFDLPSIQSALSPTRSSKLIHSLHAILRPFLLRRLKSDVETSLPPKKEYVLYAPLSEHQRGIYNAVVDGTLRALLMKEAGRSGRTPESDEEEVPLQAKMKEAKKGHKLRQTKRKTYDLDSSDNEYFRKLESGELDEVPGKANTRSVEESAKQWQRKSIMKKINNMKLQNTVMQLRKVCSHPFLFDWPTDPMTHQPVLSDELSSASGKMMVLERLLEELFRRNHKVLLFSQFTTMLDIIQDWAVELKEWPICRIDGSTSMADRRDEVRRFQTSGDAPDAPRLFLLSTRAGGLGLNLVAADTVIFYDQDWNPQMDLQAQDRAHRIGQTKPVLIFRLVSAHTIETKVMQRATEKRKLEALVIAKGQFKNPTLAAGRSKQESMAEMAASLLRLEGEKIDVVPNTAAGKASVISDVELDVLLDRRPEVFVDRGRGWTSTGPAVAAGHARSKSAKFAVYEAPAHAAGDMLAGMMDDSDVDAETSEA